MKSAALGLHTLRETFRANNGSFVQAAHDDFVFVTGFDLELNLAAINGDDLRTAMDRLADGRRCKMANINFKPHGTLISLEMQREQMTRRAFKELDDVRRRHDGGHAVAVKFHGMLHIRRDM